MNEGHNHFNINNRHFNLKHFFFLKTYCRILEMSKYPLPYKKTDYYCNKISNNYMPKIIINLILGSQCLLYFVTWLWTRRVKSPLDTSRQGNNIDHLSFYYLFRMHNSILFLSLCISQGTTDQFCSMLFVQVIGNWKESSIAILN